MWRWWRLCLCMPSSWMKTQFTPCMPSCRVNSTTCSNLPVQHNRYSPDPVKVFLHETWFYFWNCVPAHFKTDFITMENQGVERELVLETLLCVFSGPNKQEVNSALLFKSAHATHLNYCWRRRILCPHSAHLLHVCNHRSTLVSLHRVRMPWAVRQCRVTLSQWSSFQLEPPCPVSPLPGETGLPQWTHSLISSVTSLIVAGTLNSPNPLFWDQFPLLMC